MSTTKGIWRWALASAAVVFLGGTAFAGVVHNPPSVTTNTSAGIIIFPRIVVDTANGIDTEIQVTNATDVMSRALCFYVNANGHCEINGNICDQTNYQSQCAPEGGLCQQGWQTRDFRLTLTKRQPVSWRASSGLAEFPLPPRQGEPDSEQSNKDSFIPPVQEDPFVGELRCIEIDVGSEQPLAANDLMGVATVVETDNGQIDASKYNAIGIPAIEGAQDGDPNTLNIGGPDPEYNACPNILTVSHFFDYANVSTHDDNTASVTSRLTFVPCSADFLSPDAPSEDAPLPAITLQFLVFNEFEQRFSTSSKLYCYKETQLADIDTRPGDDGNGASIFSAGVEGTLTGQTRIRSVAGTGDYAGNGVLAVIEETWTSSENVSRTSANVQFFGVKNGDQMKIPDSMPSGD